MSHSPLIPLLRAIVREEMRQHRAFSLGVVTSVVSNDGGGGDNYLSANVRLRDSGLELQQVPVVVGRAGVSRAPRIDDLVVLGFLEQDIHAPVILGIVYDDKQAPPDAKPEECVYVVPDESDDAIRRFEMTLPNGNTLTVKDSQVEIAMGKTTILVKSDGNIELKSASEILLNADADITIKAGGNLNLEAGGDLNAKGLATTVEGQTNTTVKGANLQLAGITSFSAS